jgi:outer membrane protein assembly factor BamB
MYRRLCWGIPVQQRYRTTSQVGSKQIHYCVHIQLPMPGPPRRRYLQLVGAAAISGLAGCGFSTGGLTDSPSTSTDSNVDSSAGSKTGTTVQEQPSGAVASLSDRRQGWVRRLGSGTNLRYNPVPGPGGRPSSQWRVEFADEPLVVANSTTVVGVTTSAVAAYDPATGTQQWRVPASDLVDAKSMGSVEEVSLVGDRLALQPVVEGFPTIGMDPATGEQLWRAEETVPLVDNGRLFTLAAESAGLVLQRRSPDGAVTASTQLTIPTETPLLSAWGVGTLVFRTPPDATDPKLIAVNMDDGSVRWQTTTPGPFPGANALVGVPRRRVAMTGQTVFAIVRTGELNNLVAYDLATGRERWQALGGDTQRTEGAGLPGVRSLAGAPGYCYVRTRQDLTVRDERSGELLTRIEDPNGDESSTRLVVEASGCARTYLFRGDNFSNDEPAEVSIVARDPTLSETQWSLALPELRNVKSVYPIGERLLASIGSDPLELVAFG